MCEKVFGMGPVCHFWAVWVHVGGNIRDEIGQWKEHSRVDQEISSDVEWNQGKEKRKNHPKKTQRKNCLHSWPIQTYTHRRKAMIN